MASKLRKNGYWTKVRCHREAKKCSSRSEFKKKYAGAHCSARKNGWLDEICSHMNQMVKPIGYWNNKKLCHREAKKYSKRSDFKKYSRGAHGAAYKHGWLNEICSHMEYAKLPNGYWNHRKINEAIESHIGSRSCFIRNNPGAWNWANKNNYLYFIKEKIPLLTDVEKRIPRIWFKDVCAKEARKYKTRSEFFEKSKGAYAAACKNDWLDEICSHMERPNSIYHRYIYIIRFEDEKVYVGLTVNYARRKANRKKYNDRIFQKQQKIKYSEEVYGSFCLNMAQRIEKKLIAKYKKQGSALNISKGGELGAIENRLTKEEVAAIALSCSNMKELYQKHPKIFHLVYKRKWTKDLCSHMRRSDFKWDEEAIIKEFKKYKTVKEIRSKNDSAYTAARNLGILQVASAHMKRLIKRNYWTYDKCAKEVRRYNSRGKLKKGNESVYQKCLTNGWLEDLCKHMT